MIAVHRVFGAVSQIRTGDLFLTKEVLYLLSYNSINGARGGVRTRDTQIKSLVLYQLSYTSIAKEVIADTNQWKLLSHSFYMVRIVGLEPTRLASADFKSASSAYSDISASFKAVVT